MKIKALKIIFICLLLSLPAVFRLFIYPSFSFHDETQIANTFEIFKDFRLGQFPPRWSPDMIFGYGSPYPSFNYQIPYYLAYIFNLLGATLLLSYKIVLGLSLVLGLLGFFLFARQHLSVPLSFVAAILYTYAPYRAVDVYVRGTIGESLALAVFPWILFFFSRLKKNKSVANTLLLGISIAALILSHQPSTAFGLPIIYLLFIIPALFEKDLRFVLLTFLSGTVSFFISAYYLIPLFLETKFIQPVIPFNFYDHFPFIKQLIYSPWDYGGSNIGPGDYISFQLGFAQLLVIAISLIVLATNLFRKSRSLVLLTNMVLLFFVIFLMNMRSTFLWNINPFTNSIQFPWRLLSLSVLLIATLFVFLQKLLPQKMKIILSIAVVILSIFPAIFYFHPGTITNNADSYYLRRYLPNQVLLPGETVSEEYLNYTENYTPMPTDAIRPLGMPLSKVTAIRKMTVNVTDENPLNYTFDIDQPQAQPIIFNTYYYPGWQAFVDSKPVDTKANELGVITFDVPIGSHQVAVVFTDTTARVVGNWITVVALFLLLEYLLFDSLSRTDKIKVKINNQK